MPPYLLNHRPFQSMISRDNASRAPKLHQRRRYFAWHLAPVYYTDQPKKTSAFWKNHCTWTWTRFYIVQKPGSNPRYPTQTKSKLWVGLGLGSKPSWVRLSYDWSVGPQHLQQPDFFPTQHNQYPAMYHQVVTTKYEQASRQVPMREYG